MALEKEQAITIGIRSLKEAHRCFANQNYGMAFAHYLVVFEMIPEEKVPNEIDFVIALRLWAEMLEDEQHVEDLCKIFIQAMNAFPNSVDIHHEFGSALLR